MLLQQENHDHHHDAINTTLFYPLTATTAACSKPIVRRSLTHPLSINTKDAMNFAMLEDAQAPTPGSPPDLTGSKSSKSSSFHSSYQSEEDSILADINHFEDIGLDDDAR